MKGSFVKRPPSRVDEMALQVHTRVLVQTNVHIQHVQNPNDAASITGKILQNREASLKRGKQRMFLYRMVSRGEFPTQRE